MCMLAYGSTLFYEVAWKECNYEGHRRFPSIVLINLFVYRAFEFYVIWCCNR